MISFTLQQVLVTLPLLAPFVFAHPGHGGLEHEIAERSAYLKNAPRNLNHCAAKLRARDVGDTFLSRRVATVQKLQDEVKLRKRSLVARQSSSPTSTSSGSPPSGESGSVGGTGGSRSQQNISDFGSTVANTSHLSNLSISYDTIDFQSMIFGNNSCILNPEGEVGPYYVSGEYVRSDISEDQAGVTLYLDQQYIDVNTCEPIADLYADIWHCNSTGVYAGVVAQGNGNIDDTSNLNSTFLRGIQKTDDDGIVSWKTTFPGYYQGRTTHIHMVTHIGASRLINGTITGGNITHVGQLMFDQDLTDEINANVSPYTDNTQTITDNNVDSVFMAETLTDSDPVVNYVKLGNDYEDGLFAWITIGVDPDARYDASAAAVLSGDGGYTTGNTQVM